MSGLRNELTRLMDEWVRPEEKVEDDFPYVYIFTDEEGKISVFEDGDEYGWYVRFPGYTCANVRFDRRTNLVSRIVLVRRGGAYRENGDETVFRDPEELERVLNDTFRGKSLGAESK